MNRTKIIYFDTNIISILSAKQDIWKKVKDYLDTNCAWLAFSNIHMAELFDATRKHTAIAELLTSIPSALIKDLEMLVTEEVQNYPKELTNPLFLNAIPSDSSDMILKNIKSSELGKSRKVINFDADKMTQVLNNRKNNFPVSKSGVYTKEQSGLYEYCKICEQLKSWSPAFLKQFQNKPKSFTITTFRALRLAPLVVFYKYYLGKRSPGELSDFGDLWHLAYLPYCDLVVMERDLCNILLQIQKNTDLLKNTEIRNIDFINTL